MSPVPTFQPFAGNPAAAKPQRASAASRGYGRRWQKARKQFLLENPICQCGDPACRRPATEVDHIQPHRGDYDLFWNEANWQALTKECHSRKTVSEGGKTY
ncbi:MAG: HNH endonuclease signature motif containing protein [Acetobacter orientalis]|uniref:HNH endonuclease n=1 Tax=Acetobacter orientalis TaxID=146474 RepID=UPI0020A2FAFF|nr:HNH endonuclease signature motif containing protein [Acetobacter orientalis]MCP1221345.1 HNH endonuclease [Acetobacter orientalis]